MKTAFVIPIMPSEKMKAAGWLPHTIIICAKGCGGLVL